MGNPRIFFTIEQGIFYPYRGQNSILDSRFRGNGKIIKNNLDLLTDRQKEYIKRNQTKGTIYVTNKYAFNCKTFAFQFSGIPSVATDDDLNDLFTKKLGFDVTKSYSLDEEMGTSTKIDENGKYVTKLSVKQSNKLIDNIPETPTIDNSGFYIDDKKWKYLVRNIIRKKPTLLIGPTGTGKTELILMACKQLGINCEVHDMGSMQDPLTDLIGCHRIKDGSSTFDYAKFVDDVQKPGVILLDELSRAPLMTNNILFPCLDSRRELPLAIADSEGPRSVKVHTDCVFIATANIGSEYSGTQEIDAALLNRFLPLKLDYIPANYEVELLMARSNILRYDAETIVQFANQMRQKFKEGVINLPVSTRENIAMAELVADGFDLIDAVNFVVCNKFNDEDVKPVRQIMITM